jgi:hypothetical protein
MAANVRFPPIADISSRCDASPMRRANFGAVALATMLVGSCDFALGFEVLNATDTAITVNVGGDSQSVEPGLSFHGRFPGAGTFSVSAANCIRVYPVPNLETPPWKYLIGKSVKLRAMPSGMLLAYPPTPDVEVKGNPLRAESGSEVVLRPIREACR